MFIITRVIVVSLIVVDLLVMFSSPKDGMTVEKPAPQRPFLHITSFY